ncbi:MAG: hypothetical protein QOF06_1666 [Solirubrobacterales bacterium]|jgi:hypothetical protein|nr:hypothetical protein [Solirubrobacterales bacterium]
MSPAKSRSRLLPHPREAKVACGILAVLVVAAAALFVSAAGAEPVQKGNLRVSFAGRISPRALPRHGEAPIAVTVGGTITTTDGAPPPQLRGIEIAINRAGHFDHKGLPSCTYAQIQPSTTAAAMSACGPAKVGEGRFAANVVLPEQSPFPSRGRIVAFNGIERGRPVILAHVYGTEPVPLSYTLVLRMTPGKGTWGTVLSATLPRVTSDVAYVTGISLTLNRRFTAAGRTHGYVSASCPAPKGFPGATFPLARASFSFGAAGTLASTLLRSCHAKD